MKEYRSVTQILFGYLPEQTVDLGGHVWKVREWRFPRKMNVVDDRLRAAIIGASARWEAQNADNGYTLRLRQGHELDVVALDPQNGVLVESFPNVWQCRACFRVMNGAKPGRCRCGATSFGQLPFVWFHECGRLEEPFPPRCPQHNEVRARLPGTMSAREIRFECPVCNRLIRQGFGFKLCQCGTGNMTVNVHRASSVYTGQRVVVVNPPSPQRVRRLTAAGGPARALEWIVEGMPAGGLDSIQPAPADMLRTLVEQGIPERVAARMVEAGSAELEESSAARAIQALPPSRRILAEDEAVTIAMALDESRRTIADLQSNAETASPLAELYTGDYARAMRNAGLESVELVDRFPVLTANFAYTRGAPGSGQMLVPFELRGRRNTPSRLTVFADEAMTEALFVRLDARRVARWLETRGYQLLPWTDSVSARVAILEAASIPAVGQVAGQTVGNDLLTLVHSFAHRLVRRASVFAGIERDSLSELLVPLHLGFFMYAAARGDFVLGGLQAVFEGTLNLLLEDFVETDFRCALDPGCRHSGAACSACLHIGEPSCRLFNTFLDRDVLSGPTGFLRPFDAGSL